MISVVQVFSSSSSSQVICKTKGQHEQEVDCCVHLSTTTLFTVSARSQGDEGRGSDRCSVIPASSKDASGDAEPEPAATVKSLIESFDTVGQSEC